MKQYSIKRSEIDHQIWWGNSPFHKTIVLLETEVKFPDFVLFVTSEYNPISCRRTFYPRKHSIERTETLGDNVEGFGTKEEAYQLILDEIKKNISEEK